ncbi:hypothetical protein Sjap_001302 [Stephania japonica]|uniref:Exostosin GT47 domain-containing protein n=1 Tax=Stephania japonica TaxID=461633 RepID=A0AAP0KJQ1_9MAGN
MIKMKKSCCSCSSILFALFFVLPLILISRVGFSRRPLWISSSVIKNGGNGHGQLHQKNEDLINPEIRHKELMNVIKNGGHGHEQLHQSKEDLINPERRQNKELINTTCSAKLKKLEGGLARARARIRIYVKNSTQTRDPDYTPQGPVYWNANAFHRSYLEMEKLFKVFIYEEGEPPLFHNGPCKSIYSMEGNFISLMEIEPRFRTRDPEKAHVFLLPFSVTMMVNFIYDPNSNDASFINHIIVDYVNLISAKYPFWNRSLGWDHFMLSCHDWGPIASSHSPYLFNNSIRAFCNANTSEGFNPSKDVSIPEVNLLTGETKGLLGGPSPSRRPILAFFAGGLHGPIRPILLDHWKTKIGDKLNEMQIYEYLPKTISYQNMMKKSRFCICPSGYEVASPRIVEALYSGCVPVLISDHYVAPFSDVLNWKAFSVVISVDDIPDLKKILKGISPRQYIRMQRRGVQVRRHFEVNSPPKRFDVFNMILHSVWLRRLNARIRDQ